MCFSATSSFAAAGMLAGIGVLSLIHVRKKEQYLMAGIPFGFALQQLTEGFIWQQYGLKSSTYMQIMMYIFLLFAFVIWPMWIPAAVFASEHNKRRRKLLFYNVLWGMLVAVYGAYILITYPITVQITNHSIEYVFGHKISTEYVWIVYLFDYVLATILPFFISSKKIHKVFGGLLAGSLVLTYFVWTVTLVSVWCFFVALLSMLIFIDVYKK
ncbi:MAG TPA: hypothetical protein PLU71_05115 [Candidatus Dependentiae bacterium]|nr:hypothetical protein [Candidatus Dependentiae bacterium]